METEFDDMITLCDLSVKALEAGEGSTDDCCVKTRSLHFGTKLLAEMSFGVLTRSRINTIRSIFHRAVIATSEREAQARAIAEEALTKGTSDAEHSRLLSEAMTMSTDASRVATRADEVERLLADFDPHPELVAADADAAP